MKLSTCAAARCRGGIRWRIADDFRTESSPHEDPMVTERVIVPRRRPKGGFIVKLPARKRRGRREFASATRRLMRGSRGHPTTSCAASSCAGRVVRYDDETLPRRRRDKGTRISEPSLTRSPQNSSSAPGDAFAFGGSHGYDHKKEAITAARRVECVHRHFQRDRQDIQTTPFDRGRIGDMSGDGVRQPACCLSRQIRLRAGV